MEALQNDGTVYLYANNNKPSFKPVKHQILSLNGGGVRGVVSMVLLEKIFEALNKKHASKPLQVPDVFDFLAGTSAGALGISTLLMRDEKDFTKPKYTPEQAIEITKEFSKKIFHNSCLNKLYSVDGLLHSKYTITGLQDMIKSVAPENPKISDLMRPILIPTVVMPTKERQSWLPFYFTRDNSNVYLSDLLEGAVAAPTYFPAKLMNGQYHLDGGLFANEPDSIAAVGAINYYKCSFKDLSLVSIGTGQCPYYLTPGKEKNMGDLGWFPPQIINAMFEVQQFLARDITAGILEDRFCPLQVGISSEHAALDDASPGNIDYLEHTAAKWADDHRGYIHSISSSLKISDTPMPIYHAAKHVKV